jgi:hypothetical protein
LSRLKKASRLKDHRWSELHQSLLTTHESKINKAFHVSLLRSRCAVEMTGFLPLAPAVVRFEKTSTQTPSFGPFPPYRKCASLKSKQLEKRLKMTTGVGFASQRPLNNADHTGCGQTKKLKKRFIASNVAQGNRAARVRLYRLGIHRGREAVILSRSGILQF